MSNRSLWLVLVLASVPAAAADVYKWIDAGGVVHYSDTEPTPELKAQRLHLAGMSTSDVKAGATDPSDPANAPAGPDNAREGTQVSSVQSAERRCSDARNNLEVLQSKFAVGFDAQGNGKPEVLDDQGRQLQIARAQTTIATYCK